MRKLPPTTCEANPCDRPAAKRGYCQGHYMRWFTGKPVDGPLRPYLAQTGCRAEGCDQPHSAKGYCKTHYNMRLDSTKRAAKRAARRTASAPLPGERWRPVVGFEGMYEVSDLGRVRGIDRLVSSIGGPPNSSDHSRIGGRLLGSDNAQPYPAVGLSRNGKLCARRVHVLVAEAFLGPRPDGMVINHIDHDKRNNRLSNLEYVTQRENVRQAIAADRWARVE